MAGARIYALPMKIGDGSGGPVRIFATINDECAGRNFACNLSSLFNTFWLAVLVIMPRWFGII